MSAVVVVGAQWGDEGKGKIVDLYTQFADVVVRYGGGANAGHTLVVNGEKVVLHLIPSGALHPKTRCVLSQGMVIDPKVLLEEIALLTPRGLVDKDRLLVSDRAHVVLPQHPLVDGLRDKGEGVGTTKRGIGPTYQDKAARKGLRMGDLLRPALFREKLQKNLEGWEPVVRALGGELPRASDIEATFLEMGEKLRPYITDTAQWMAEAIQRGENILFEGAQGTLLDVDHGTYPFVTSSSTVAGGACTGTGLGPTAIDQVVGITKAYATRVGSGPFPTELSGELGDKLREVGEEYGATTGRPRRCGWLDIPALRYAVRVNGMGGLAVTKLDVLTNLKKVDVCVGYELDGTVLKDLPYEGLERVKPVYESFPGWTGDLAAARSLADFPENARRYVQAIETLAGCPIVLVSVGPDRAQTIQLRNPFRLTS